MLATRPAAVICDMDGLLVDSERLERRVWQRAADDLGIEMSDARFLTFVGHPLDECERMLLAYYGESFDLPHFRARCLAHMREIVDAEGVPMRPGAVDWIDFVAALGIPLGLATSSGPRHVRDRLGDVAHRFAAIVTRADVARGKPHPDLYLEAASRLGVPPSNALALEDSPTGASAAIAAGMHVIIVPDLVSPPLEIVTSSAGVYDSLDAVRAAASAAWAG